MHNTTNTLLAALLDAQKKESAAVQALLLALDAKVDMAARIQLCEQMEHAHNHAMQIRSQLQPLLLAS